MRRSKKLLQESYASTQSGTKDGGKMNTTTNSNNVCNIFLNKHEMNFIPNKHEL